MKTKQKSHQQPKVTFQVLPILKYSSKQIPPIFHQHLQKCCEAFSDLLQKMLSGRRNQKKKCTTHLKDCHSEGYSLPVVYNVYSWLNFTPLALLSITADSISESRKQRRKLSQP